MTHIEALKMALELLAVATYHSPELQAKRTEVIDAGLKALSSGATVAQPQGGHTFYDANGNVVAHLDATADITMDYAKPSVWAKAEQPPLNEQEPVAWLTEERYAEMHTSKWTPKIQQVFSKDGILESQTIQYAPQSKPVSYPPPQRTWVGLTAKEVADIVVYPMNPTADVVKAIEAKLKEKNT